VNRPFEYAAQRPDGTYQVISDGNPVPVTVRGMPALQDDVVAHLDILARAMRETSAEDTNRINVELWWLSWAACGQIEKTRKALLWCFAGMGLLQLAVIAVLIWVRV
jgi:hypothetical protein